MSFVLEQLRMKSVGMTSANIQAGESSVRPFGIALGKTQILLIHGVQVMALTSSNINAFVQWYFIQKNELRADGISTGILAQELTDNVGVNDADIFAMGQHKFVISTASDNIQLRQEHLTRMIWFPKPICVPRSPTFILHNSSQSPSTLSYRWLIASLYYETRSVPFDIVRSLLKQFVGRRQDVVSNIPPVQEA